MADGEVTTRGKTSAGDGAEWVGLAWAAWVRGERNYTALGKQFGKDRETVRDNLNRYSAARTAELSGGADPTAEYLDGLVADMQDTQRLARSTELDFCKVACLKHSTAIREKLAAARGVVTERKALNFGGRVAVDIAREWETVASDPIANEAAYALADRAAACAADTGQLSPEAEP